MIKTLTKLKPATILLTITAISLITAISFYALVRLLRSEEAEMSLILTSKDNEEQCSNPFFPVQVKVTLPDVVESENPTTPPASTTWTSVFNLFKNLFTLQSPSLLSNQQREKDLKDLFNIFLKRDLTDQDKKTWLTNTNYDKNDIQFRLIFSQEYQSRILNINSTQGQEAGIKELYQNLFQKDIDENTLKEFLSKNYTILGIEYKLIFTQEYYDRFITKKDYKNDLEKEIYTLYRKILRRPPDANGVNFYYNQFINQSNLPLSEISKQIRLTFFKSDEFNAKLNSIIDYANIEGGIDYIYTSLFNYPPTQSEIQEIKSFNLIVPEVKDFLLYAFQNPINSDPNHNVQGVSIIKPAQAQEVPTYQDQIEIDLKLSYQEKQGLFNKFTAENIQIIPLNNKTLAEIIQSENGSSFNNNEENSFSFRYIYQGDYMTFYQALEQNNFNLFTINFQTNTINQTTLQQSSYLQLNNPNIKITLQDQESKDLTIKLSNNQPNIYDALKVCLAGGEENQPPQANAGEDKTIAPNQTITLDGSKSSDPNGDTLTYKWEITQGGGSLIDENQVQAQYTAFGEEGQATIKLTVSDGELEAVDEVGVVVEKVITGAIIKGQVALEGRDGIQDANPTFLQVRIKRPVEDTAIFRDDYVATYQIEENNDNIYFFEIDLTGKLELGNYDISVKEWHYLDAVKNIDLALGENNLDIGELEAGDVNNNDLIDMDPNTFTGGEDWDIFYAFYDKEVGSISLPPYPSINQPVAWHADINNDGIVDAKDEVFVCCDNNPQDAGSGVVRLIVTGPIGGTVGYPIWIEGETRSVKWTTEPQGISLNTIKLQYALDQGDYADLTGAVPNTGQYEWQVANNLVGSNIKMRLAVPSDSFYYALSGTYAQLAVLPKRTTPAYPIASNVLVVYNNTETQGKEIAEHYLSKRPGACLLSIDIPGSVRLGAYGEEIARDNYEQYIRNPIKDWLDANSNKDIRYVVLTKGVPLKIKRTSGSILNESSVDSELSLIYSDYNKIYDSKTATSLENPYYYYKFDNDNLFKADGLKYLFQPNYFYNYYWVNSTAQFKINYLVTRLDGYAVADVKAMIDRAVVAKKDNYYWILDDGGKAGSDYDRMMGANPYLVLNNKWAKTVLEQDLGMANYVVYEDAQKPIYSNPKDPQGAVIAYIGHGKYDGCPNNCITDLFNFNLAPGALYSSYESFNAWGFHDKDQQPTNTDHTQVGEWIAIGGSGGVGNIYEPYANTIANEAIWMPAYAAGYPLADAFYMSLPQLSWNQVVIGDPLTNISSN